MSGLENFLLARFGYLKVVQTTTIPGLPFCDALPRHIYDQQRAAGAITDADDAVLFRWSAKPVWGYVFLGIGLGLLARSYRRTTPLARYLSYLFPLAGLSSPLIVDLRTRYLLGSEQERVFNALGEAKVQSVRWWIDVRRELPGEWERVVSEKVGRGKELDVEGPWGYWEGR